MAAQATSSRGERWLVTESDFGGPMVEHVHPNGTAVAYVLMGTNGHEFAQCTDCGERKSLAGPEEARPGVS